jgi:hypothetical protein
MLHVTRSGIDLIMHATHTKDKALASTEGQSSVLDMAIRYLHAGLSVIPIRSDGSKRPALDKWGTYQQRLPTEDELRDWFGDGRWGVGIVGGKVSGHLEHIDFDARADEIFPAWSALVEAECPGLVARLSTRTTGSAARAAGRSRPASGRSRSRGAGCWRGLERSRPGPGLGRLPESGLAINETLVPLHAIEDSLQVHPVVASAGWSC